MRLTTQHPYDGIQLAAPFCKRSSMIKDDRKKAEVIKRVVCSYLGLQQTLIISRGRKGHIVEARQMAMYFIRKYTRLSLKQTGMEFGGLDHSTVIHAAHTVNNTLSYDKLYMRKFKDVETKIKQELIIA
jgi:chromosomal replication initiation ATPase DnaA